MVIVFCFEDLYLRKITKTDLHNLLALKQDSGEFTHRTSILNIEDQENWFNSMDNNQHQPNNLILIAEILVDDPYYRSPIGDFKIINIDYQNRKAHIGYDIFKFYRGKKFGAKLVQAGTEFCFQILNLHRVTAEILETNIRSIKCAEKNRFIKEGIQKQAAWKNNKYIDSFWYGKVRDD